MSDEKVDGLTKRLALTKEMMQKRKSETPNENRKADQELRRLKKIVRRVANKKRRLAGPVEGTAAKEG